MPGVPKKPHDGPALSLTVAVGLGLARQMGQVVWVQRHTAADRYPLSLTGETPKNRAIRNCYQVTPEGEILPCAGNPPYVEHRSERERERRRREDAEARLRGLRARENAFREAEKKLGFVPADVAGIVAEDVLTREGPGPADGEPLRGALCLEGPEGYFAALVALDRGTLDVRVLLVGPRASEADALKSALAFVGRA